MAGSEVRQNDAAVQEFKLTFIESGNETTSADDTAMELRPTQGVLNILEGGWIYMAFMIADSRSLPFPRHPP